MTSRWRHMALLTVVFFGIFVATSLIFPPTASAAHPSRDAVFDNTFTFNLVVGPADAFRIADSANFDSTTYYIDPGGSTSDRGGFMAYVDDGCGNGCGSGRIFEARVTPWRMDKMVTVTPTSTWNNSFA